MSKPLIAIDFDDTLSRSNEAIAAAFGTYFPPHDLTLDNFSAFHYWKTPHWGDAKQAAAKIATLFAAGVLQDVPPLQSDLARPLTELKQRGYALCIITARPPSLKQQTLDWIAKHLPDGTFDHIVFTGAYQHLSDPDHPDHPFPPSPSNPSNPPFEPAKSAESVEPAESVAAEAASCKAQITDAHAAHHPAQAKAAHDAVQPALSEGNKKKALTKAEVIRDLGACALIDDSLENCLNCHQAGIQTYLFSPLPPTPAIPVPHWPWNLRPSTLETPEDYMSYEERTARGIVQDLKKDIYGADIPMPDDITRVTSWDDVLNHFPPLPSA